MVLLGTRVQGANNYISRDTWDNIGLAVLMVLPANPQRSAYRIFASPVNVDNVVIGYNNAVTVVNSFNIVGPGEMSEDSGWLECFKGEIWLISGTNNMVVIVEEVVLVREPRW